MHRQGQRIHILLITSVVAGLVSCRTDNSSITAPRPQLSLQSPSSSSGFSADVAVTISPVDLKGVAGAAPAQQFSYHVERVRKTGENWKTVYSNMVLPLDRETPPLGAGSGSRAARFELDDAGRLTGFNEAGALIDPHFTTIPATFRRYEGALQSLVESEINSRGPDSTAEGSGTGRFLLDRAKQRALIQRLERTAKKTQQNGRRVAYAVESPSGTTVLTADNDLGAIIASERRSRVGPVTRVAYEFTPLPSGQYLRSHIRLERDAFENRPGLTVDTRLSNVQVADQEGK
jgi:hypothetical protein